MRPIQTRADLMRVLARNAPSNACQHLLEVGKALVLGGFTPPESLPCYITRVKSPHGRVWHLVLSVNDQTHQYRITTNTSLLDDSDPYEPPWDYWDGKVTSSTEWSLVNGDDPAFGLMCKNRSTKDGKATNPTED